MITGDFTEDYENHLVPFSAINECGPYCAAVLPRQSLVIFTVGDGDP